MFSTRFDMKIRVVLLLVVISFSSIFILVFPCPWPPTGDAYWYVLRAQGQPVHAPFNSRVLVPFVVGLFPESIHQQVFILISLISMSATCLFLFEYLRTYDMDIMTCFLGAMIWMMSEGYWYYLGTPLVDSTFLALWAVFFLFLRKDMTSAVIPIIVVSMLVKETALLMVPLFLIYLSQSKIRGQRKLFYGISSMGITGGLLLLLRTCFGSVEYSIDTIIRAFEYHGIETNNIPLAIGSLLVYVVVCLLWLFGILGASPILGFIKSEKQTKVNVVALSLMIVPLILLAADWWRMLLYIFPLYFAVSMKPIDSVVKYLEYKRKSFLNVAFLALASTWLIAMIVVSKAFTFEHPLIIRACISAAFGIAPSMYLLKRRVHDKKENMDPPKGSRAAFLQPSHCFE